VLVLHAAAGALLLVAGTRVAGPGRAGASFVQRAPEILAALTAVLFLFTYIYATNANMDYVQRFMLDHDNLRLAPNSSTQRLIACLRFLPLLALDLAWYVAARIGGPASARERGLAAAAGRWALPMSLASALAWALAFPSFLDAGGIAVLGWICLVPLIVCLMALPVGWGVFYGTLAGVVQTMVSNYWLGTFNLLTLQFVSVVTLVQYVPFMAIALLVLKRARGAGFLVLPAAWTVFDWVRSQGFLGYPWGMLGTSQYAVLPVIQVASLGGVWAVTFVVTLVNAAAAWYIAPPRGMRRTAAPLLAAGATLVIALGWAGIRALQERATPAAPHTARLALVQQDEDPRKDDYAKDFEVLKQLTDATLASNPDLVVWSETAFVPNIRRWSQEDPGVYPYAALVRDFLAYQRSRGRWLLTGNDDYSLQTVDGQEQRLDYNGAVLFSPGGERVETYHKIHLVPFTEYFPYRKQLPGVYKLLLSFDSYLWEPGDQRVVFRHPLLSFSTPICFEDVFPRDVRRFVAAGAQVIVNISNDYWSLTDAEAMQHAANAVFRAVENGVPLARASASGLTCLVMPDGRITDRAPLFQPASLVVDVPVRPVPGTPYTRAGDWFPPACAGFLLALLGVVLVRRR
jgi:apolipoprotein N-acyltransferase